MQLKMPVPNILFQQVLQIINLPQSHQTQAASACRVHGFQSKQGEL